MPDPARLLRLAAMLAAAIAASASVAQTAEIEPLRFPERSYDAFVSDEVANAPFRMPEPAFRLDAPQDDWALLHSAKIAVNRIA